MRVRLAYGERGLEIDAPDGATLIESAPVPGVPDERAALLRGLRQPLVGPPLAELVRGGQRAVLVFPDVTRAFPSRRVVPVVLAELEAAGFGPERLTLLSGTGTHRANTPAELEQMLGADVLRRYRVVNHDARAAETLVLLGSTSQGAPALLDRVYIEADVRVVVGLIEPHFFAGYSGGAKGVCPGVAGLETVLFAHDRTRIGDPLATWGCIAHNPVQQLVREVVALAPPTFTLDVTVNKQGRITGVFSGEGYAAHAAGCAFVAGAQEQAVPHEYDIVVTTNGGYPLDQNLYQAVKGLSAAARIVRRGGSIVLAAECRDGIPSHGSYGAILAAAHGPHELFDLLHDGAETTPDQWQAQVQAIVQEKARVYAFCGGLSAAQIRVAHFEPVESVEAALRALLARQPDASIAILPEGPYTVATPRGAGDLRHSTVAPARGAS
ncbi:MAG TPA: nickel-dependent lactate racemase [Dehalococcoidia bacterium]|nr:nickel-dependent lactate racemase [Dehalococcoidia bacterium]